MSVIYYISLSIINHCNIIYYHLVYGIGHFFVLKAQLPVVFLTKKIYLRQSASLNLIVEKVVIFFSLLNIYTVI